MPTVDFTGWPTWAILALLIVNLFKQAVARVLPETVRQFFAGWTDTREHRQTIEEALINHRMQGAATDDLRKSWREENWMEALNRKDNWILGELNKRLETINETNRAILAENVRIRGEIKRSANIQETIHISLSKLADSHRELATAIARMISDREPA